MTGLSFTESGCDEGPSGVVGWWGGGVVGWWGGGVVGWWGGGVVGWWGGGVVGWWGGGVVGWWGGGVGGGVVGWWGGGVVGWWGGGVVGWWGGDAPASVKGQINMEGMSKIRSWNHSIILSSMPFLRLLQKRLVKLYSVCIKSKSTCLHSSHMDMDNWTD